MMNEGIMNTSFYLKIKIKIIKTTYFAIIARNFVHFISFLILRRLVFVFCFLKSYTMSDDDEVKIKSHLKLNGNVECRHSDRERCHVRDKSRYDAGSAKGSKQANQMTKRNRSCLCFVRRWNNMVLA